MKDLKAIKDAERYINETDNLLKNNDLAKNIERIETQIDSFNRTQSRIALNLSKLK